jgi:nucleotide-binding universal stress UspA family protein
MKNILIPVDGSDYSIKAIEAGKQIASAFDSKVTILTVIPLEMSRGVGKGNLLHVPTVDGGMADLSQQILNHAKKPLEGMPNEIITVSKQGNVAEIIVKYAHKNEIDLVIMGSQGLGALKTRLMTGSVTTKVLHRVNVPVLVIK